MLRGFFGNLVFAIIARMLCGNHLKYLDLEMLGKYCTTSNKGPACTTLFFRALPTSTQCVPICVTARRDTIVITRLSRLILLAAIGSPIGRQFPYVNIDWSFFCVLEAISRPISYRWNRVASETSGRPDVQFWKVRLLVGIWSESWRMFQFTLPLWMY